MSDRIWTARRKNQSEKNLIVFCGFKLFKNDFFSSSFISIKIFLPSFVRIEQNFFGKMTVSWLVGWRSKQKKKCIAPGIRWWWQQRQRCAACTSENVNQKKKMNQNLFLNTNLLPAYNILVGMDESVPYTKLSTLTSSRFNMQRASMVCGM